MVDLITEFFIKPIMNPEVQGYNLVNTATYIVLLVLACAIIYHLLKKKITFDYHFFFALIPYILFGISMRVIMHQTEAGLLSLPWLAKTANPLEAGFWFFTPGIWILTFSIVVIGLLLGGILTKINLKRVFYFGVCAMIVPLLFDFSRFNNWIPFLATTILIIAAIGATIFLVKKFTKYPFLHDKLNICILAGQAIDGIASTVAITFFSFSEQHVVSNILINIHPAIFVIVKIALAILIAWSLDDYAQENPKKKNLVGFIKVIIAILGCATGLASLVKIGLI